MTITLVCDNLEDGRKRIRIPETGEILETGSTWENFLRRRGSEFDRTPQYVSFSDTAQREHEKRVEKEVKDTYRDHGLIAAVIAYRNLTRDGTTGELTVGLLEGKRYVEDKVGLR